jgi:hypothetical protein
MAEFDEIRDAGDCNLHIIDNKYLEKPLYIKQI